MLIERKAHAAVLISALLLDHVSMGGGGGGGPSCTVRVQPVMKVVRSRLSRLNTTITEHERTGIQHEEDQGRSVTLSGRGLNPSKSNPRSDITAYGLLFSAGFHVQ